MNKQGKLLYNKLPEIYRLEDKDKHLSQFLDVLGVGLEYLNTKIKEYTRLFDVDTVSPELLPLLANMLGYDLPLDMNDIEQRKIIKALPMLLKLKGTATCFEYLGREVFGWETFVRKNDIFETNSKESLLNNDVILRKELVNIEIIANAEEKFLSNKIDNYKKFTEFFRPVNLVLQIIMAYMYDEEYDRKRITSNMLDLVDIYVEENYLKNIKDTNTDTLSSEDGDIFEGVYVDRNIQNLTEAMILDLDKFSKVMYEVKDVLNLETKNIGELSEYTGGDKFNTTVLKDKSMVLSLKSVYNDRRNKDSFEGMAILNNSRYNLGEGFILKSLYSYDTIIENGLRRVIYV